MSSSQERTKDHIFPKAIAWY